MTEEGPRVQTARECSQKLPHLLDGMKLQEFELIQMQDACRR